MPVGPVACMRYHCYGIRTSQLNHTCPFSLADHLWERLKQAGDLLEDCPGEGDGKKLGKLAYEGLFQRVAVILMPTLTVEYADRILKSIHEDFIKDSGSKDYLLKDCFFGAVFE